MSGKVCSNRSQCTTKRQQTKNKQKIIVIFKTQKFCSVIINKNVYNDLENFH